MKSSPRRLFAASFALVAVLFSQLAISAYACPGGDGMRLAVQASEEGPPCHEQETPAPTPLCQAHCQQGDQSSDARAASFPAAAFVALPLWSAMTSPPGDPRAIEAQPSLLERPTGPPLAVRHCCFRI